MRLTLVTSTLRGRKKPRDASVCEEFRCCYGRSTTTVPDRNHTPTSWLLDCDIANNGDVEAESKVYQLGADSPAYTAKSSEIYYLLTSTGRSF
jgi:hypothetical protein